MIGTRRALIGLLLTPVAGLLSPIVSVADMPEDHTSWSTPVFRSAYRLIATAEEWTVLDTIQRPDLEGYLQIFWKRRDPTPSTELNEFKRQFEERVDIALTRYRAVPTRAPWDARGDCYIKFGPPDEMEDRVHGWYEVRHYGPQLEQSSTILEEGELWYYYGRNLRLQFQPHGFEYEMVPFVAFGGESQSRADFADRQHYVDTAQTSYEPPQGLQFVDAVMECYPFRRSDGLYDVYVATAVPLGSMAHTTGYRSKDVAYVARIMAFDSTLQQKWADSASVHYHFERVPRGRLAQNHWSTKLLPGLYVFAVEMQDSSSDKRAVVTYDRWLVPFADTAELDLSPLVLAADVREASEAASPFVRNGREIIAMPGHVFRSDQDVCFYHEVYNLNHSDEGLCSYLVEYAVYDEKDQSRRVLASRELQSEERHTYQAGRIPFAELDKGRYILEAKTTDLISGVTKTALTKLRID